MVRRFFSIVNVPEYLALMLVLLLGFGCWRWRVASGPHDVKTPVTPLRVLYLRLRPFMDRTPDGKPTGFAVDVMNEAAGRRHIPIVWVSSTKSADVVLPAGEADLWPMAFTLPRSLRHFYVSRPWTKTGMWLVTLKSSGINSPADAAGRELLYRGTDMERWAMKKDFPDAKLIPSKSMNQTEVMDSVCRGDVPGGEIVVGSELATTLQPYHDCAADKLKFIPLPNGEAEVGIGASLAQPGAREAADLLRNEIISMARDASLAKIYFKWFLDPSNDATQIYLLEDAERQNRYLIAGVSLLFGMVALLGWQTRRVWAARGAAEDASRAKSQFLANMSHEIRTPMNGVIGMTELALESHDDSERQEYLKTVKSSAATLLTLINDILDFSKIEAGKLELESRPFHLQSTVSSALRTIAVAAHEKGLELACRIASNVPDWLAGDAGRLNQIVLNLVGNAVKFTPDGEVVLDVSLRPSRERRAMLHFAIKDTGIGIPASKQALIFDPFRQADGSTTRRFGGTGLGLAICRRLVSLMRGDLWVDSEPGKGSVFHFTAEFEVSAPEWTEVPQSLPPDARILIVDDNSTSRGILGDLFNRWHTNPQVVSSGAEALKLVEKYRFDLVLVDAGMPDMNGYETADRIRALENGADTKIVLLNSMGAHPAHTLRSRTDLSVDYLLPKPVESACLLEKVRTLLFNLTADSTTGDRDDASGRPELVDALDQRRPLHVLLVEDNPVNQTVGRIILEKRGFIVTTAANGRQAVAQVEKQPFNLVLMDVQMPEMDGFEATALIRANESARRAAGSDRPRLPIIAMTAHAMVGDREQCLAAGMDGYLAKPIQMNELLAEIQEAALQQLNSGFSVY